MAKNSSSARLGKLKPRYKFALNQFSDCRWNKCPECHRANYPRKFGLMMNVQGYGLFVLRKTCRYCPRCEFIIAHQDELEHTLATNFSTIAPEVIGNEYLVLGTVDIKFWKNATENGADIKQGLEHMADIKTYTKLSVGPVWVQKKS